MKNILLILFCIYSLHGNSQRRTDSIIPKLPFITDVKEKAQALYNIYWGFVYSDPDSAKGYCYQALELGQKNGDDTIVMGSYNLIGIMYDVISEPDSALKYYDSAMKYAISLNDESQTAGVYNNIGLIHWNNGNYDKAIEKYLKSESIYLKIDKKKGLANCYGNIGLIYSDLNDYKKAIDYQNRALKLHQELKNFKGEQSVKLNIAINILSVFNLESTPQDDSLALAYLNYNELYYMSQPNYYTVGKVYAIKATYYSENNQHDSAYIYGEKSLEAYRELGSKNLLASSLYNSSFYIVDYNNDRVKANKRVFEAYEIIKNTWSKDFIYNLTVHIANIYFENGEYKLAGEKYQEGLDLWDSIFGPEKQKLIYEMEAKYESEKKENEINKQKSQLLESDLKSLKKQRMINILISSLAVLGLLGFFYFLRRKKLAQIEKEQAIQIEREKGLKAVIESQETERTRIAKNLHDGVIQQLVSLKFGMDSLFDEHKTKLVEQLDDATYELRDLSHELMPKNLTKFGLNEALDNLFETSLEHTGIDYSYDCNNLKEDIPKNIEINLYRAVQELIHNVLKHSQGSKIDAHLYQLDKNLHLIFEDDGIGFDSEKFAGGIGLQSLKSRISTLKGEIHYESNEGQGTVVTINIPL